MSAMAAVRVARQSYAMWLNTSLLAQLLRVPHLNGKMAVRGVV